MSVLGTVERGAIDVAEVATPGGGFLCSSVAFGRSVSSWRRRWRYGYGVSTAKPSDGMTASALSAAWVKINAKTAAQAATLAQQRCDADARANTAGTLATRAVAALAAANRPEVKNYYAANPADAHACLPVDRLRAIADSDAAALAAARASGDRAGAVPDPTAGGR